MKCGAVEGFEPPFCCDSCNEEWHVKLEEQTRQYNEDVKSGKRNKWFVVALGVSKSLTCWTAEENSVTNVECYNIEMNLNSIKES